MFISIEQVTWAYLNIFTIVILKHPNGCFRVVLITILFFPDHKVIYMVRLHLTNRVTQ